VKLLNKIKESASPPVKGEKKTAIIPQDDRRKIEDILDLLDIKPTFDIPDTVFMPEDLSNVTFNIQVPQGYDTGQVLSFLSQTRQTVKFFVILLKRRNGDVAKLASTVDKLQVDLNNLRFESEMAAGINIMPTQDDDDLENQLMDSRLRNKNLEDEIARLNKKTSVPANNDKAVGKLRNEISILSRENQELSEEIFSLKSQVALHDENNDIDLTLPLRSEVTKEELQELGVQLPDVSTPDDSIQLPSPDIEFLVEDRKMLSSDDGDMDEGWSTSNDSDTTEGLGDEWAIEPEEDDDLDLEIETFARPVRDEELPQQDDQYLDIRRHADDGLPALPPIHPSQRQIGLSEEDDEDFLDTMVTEWSHSNDDD
jgi:hypothetical protein